MQRLPLDRLHEYSWFAALRALWLQVAKSFAKLRNAVVPEMAEVRASACYACAVGRTGMCAWRSSSCVCLGYGSNCSAKLPAEQAAALSTGCPAPPSLICTPSRPSPQVFAEAAAKEYPTLRPGAIPAEAFPLFLPPVPAHAGRCVRPLLR